MSPDRSCGQSDALPPRDWTHSARCLSQMSMVPSLHMLGSAPSSPLEIIQAIWLSGPVARNGEWIVVRVVGGDVRGGRPGGILVGVVGRHWGRRRGLPDGKHGQVFASNMKRLPRPSPAA